jgi:phosphoglycerate kinase
MSTYPSLRDADLDGKRVLLRAGFDVPIENGVITDISRIEAVIPTMTYVIQHNAALIIMAHQDRPKGKVVPEFSQRPLVSIIEKLLGRPVKFASSCVGEDTKKMVDALAPGEILLLENLRYDAREEANDEAFAEELASLADVYVNDAFSNSHRKHASMVAVAKMLPAYMGLNLEQEVTHLSKATDNPRHPLTLIISGAKIETKLPVVEYFMDKGDDILVGGAIANTFAGAAGQPVGTSLCEPDFYPTARAIMAKKGARIHVPDDGIVAVSPEAKARPSMLSDVHADEAIYDIGDKTIDRYCEAIARSKTIVWNGPLGMYEQEQFSGASKRIARAIADATKKGALSLIGGGDTIDFHTRYNLPLDAYTFMSTGGGAMLDLVSGKKLPALEALKRA